MDTKNSNIGVNKQVVEEEDAQTPRSALKKYSRPQLITLGDMRQVTLAGSAPNPDSGSGFGMF